MDTEPVGVEYRWRGPVSNAELNALHAEAFEHPLVENDWRAQLERFSLGWVVARDTSGLIGFVNIVWDGGVHGFVEDTVVAARARRRGVGRGLIQVAEEQARAENLEWLHVDFEDDLRAFYFDACGFRPTNAGLIRL